MSLSKRESNFVVLIVALVIAVMAFTACGGSEKLHAWHKDNVADLGSTARSWKDVYFDGILYSDGTQIAAGGAVTGSYTGTLGADTVSAASMIAANVVDSSEINDNAVGTAQLFINSVTLLVAAGTSTNSVTVDSGHELMGYYLSTIGGINGANLLNDIAYDGTNSWTMAMKNAVSADAVWTINFVSDN